jgi:hypothetical protein
MNPVVPVGIVSGRSDQVCHFVTTHNNDLLSNCFPGKNSSPKNIITSYVINNYNKLNEIDPNSIVRSNFYYKSSLCIPELLLRRVRGEGSSVIERVFPHPDFGGLLPVP